MTYEVFFHKKAQKTWKNFLTVNVSAFISGLPDNFLIPATS
jgi:mRNA-degrading endonuclease RelE of RelBE toxin-antitoxin system